VLLSSVPRDTSWPTLSCTLNSKIAATRFSWRRYALVAAHGYYEPENKTRAIPRASGIFQRDDASPTRDGSLFVNKILNASVTMLRFNCLEIWLEASFRARPRSPTYREITAFSAFLLLRSSLASGSRRKDSFPSKF